MRSDCDDCCLTPGHESEIGGVWGSVQVFTESRCFVRSSLWIRHVRAHDTWLVGEAALC